MDAGAIPAEKGAVQVIDMDHVDPAQAAYHAAGKDDSTDTSLPVVTEEFPSAAEKVEFAHPQGANAADDAGYHDYAWKLIDRDVEGRLEVASLAFWRSCITEFIGMTLFLFVAVGSIIGVGGTEQFTNPKATLDTAKVMGIAFGFGMGLMSAIYLCADNSGGNLNPAVSWALFVRGRMSLVRTCFYCLFQMAGATAGVGIINAIIPYPYGGKLGTTALAAVMGTGQGVAMEGILTMVLVGVVLSTTYPKTQNIVTAPLMIGMAVFACHLVGVTWTGCGINPARSFGSAAISGSWTNQWIYWVGPFWGSTLMGLLFDINWINIIGFQRRTFRIGKKSSMRDMMKRSFSFKRTQAANTGLKSV